MLRGFSFVKFAIWISLVIWFVSGWITTEPKRVSMRTPVSVQIPCEPGAALPSLTVDEKGQPLISWVDRTSDGVAVIRFSRWENQGWSAPKEVVRGDTWFVNWADFPTMSVLNDGTMAVHWLDKISSDTYAYGIKISLSGDRGESWSPAIIPHTDRSPSEHGFLSMKSLGDRFHLAWLDGRETLNGKPMTLRSRFLDRSGALSEEVLLDDSVCDCCPVDAVVGADQALTFYRDRDYMEVRDIAWIRQGVTDGDPDNAALLHGDGWVQPGCPVNGPAVAGDPQSWAAAWYTESDSMAPEGEGAVLLRGGGLESDSSAPVHRIDAGKPLGRVDLCELPNGDYLVSWLEQREGRAQVSLRYWKPGSKPGVRWVVAETSAGRKSGFPKIMPIPESSQALVAFTAFDEENRSRVETVLIDYRSR
ncbi:hypothetical protein CBD41_09585 [bacterium TMED181]|nr:hypothetical protein [Planctomycetota bacterium]OUW42215.1 MAG: hypothetical protein CBD41_09585 [bacterium TMED181]